MVYPSLWGPSAWQALFACTWNCTPGDYDKLSDLVDVMGQLLPCSTCRKHFLQNRNVATRRAKGAPACPEEMLYWLYCLKDEVNRSMRQPSISYRELLQRFAFHGGVVVDEVRLGDTLVVFAMAADRSATRDTARARFAELCRLLGELLPVPDDSELRLSLLRIGRGRRSIGHGDATIAAATSARIERGFPTLGRAHYTSFLKS